MIRLLLPLAPKGKGRPRLTRSGRAFTPKATRDWEAAVRGHARLQWKGAPLDGPVAVSILAVHHRPQRLQRKRDPAGMIWKPSTPDADNIAKAVNDALNGIAFHDDAQVCRLVVETVYCAKNQTPHVQVLVSPLRPYSAASAGSGAGSVSSEG